MKTALASKVIPLLLLGAARLLAEPGDFDGDGRLSIADIVHRLNNQPIAPGSDAGFETSPCFAPVTPWPDRVGRIQCGLTYLESLRRGIDGALPHWERIWAPESRQERLIEDSRVSFQIQAPTADGGESDSTAIPILLTTTVAMKAFSLILESPEDVLRVPYQYDGNYVPDYYWNDIYYIADGNTQNLGDLRIGTAFQTYLITGGRIVLTYGLNPNRLDLPPGIEPGSYQIMLQARLPKGLLQGQYSISFHEASEVLLSEGSLIAPRLGAPSVLDLKARVSSGWDEAAPSLDLDDVGQKVFGKVEFRLANEEGVAPSQGLPVAEAGPGDVITLRVQMRTEVPLNIFSFRLEWYSDQIECAEIGGAGSRIVFANPEDGELYQAYLNNIGCSAAFFGFPANHHATFALLGGLGEFAVNQYTDRPLEYYKPLGNWADVSEFKLRIKDCALPGSNVMLSFREYSSSDGNNHPGPSYRPYGAEHPCSEGDLIQNWTYDLNYIDGYVSIRDPPGICAPLPDGGIRFVIAEAIGRPGQEVELPVLASAELPLEELTLALECDPPEAVTIAMDVKVKSLRSGTFVSANVKRGEDVVFRECDVPNNERTCTYGIPGAFGLYNHVEGRFTYVGLASRPFRSSDPLPNYPGQTLDEVLRLRVKIPEDIAATKVTFRAATVNLDAGPFPDLQGQSGGYVRDPSFMEFSPAKEVREGTITIAKSGGDFIRGDSNQDRLVDVSDAVWTLNHLFLGGNNLRCEDSADADDNGTLEITDPIYLLGALFLGSAAIAKPYPDCGLDEALDMLNCAASGCSGG